MIVVDTCVIVHLYNETELTWAAQKILSANPYWCLPSTWRVEYANVIAKLFRQNPCKEENVLKLYLSTCEQLEECECEIDTSQALRLALKYKISVYDAHFVALAEQLETQLITEDIEVLKKFKQAIAMKDFINA